MTVKILSKLKAAALSVKTLGLDPDALALWSSEALVRLSFGPPRLCVRRAPAD